MTMLREGCSVLLLSSDNLGIGWGDGSKNGCLRQQLRYMVEDMCEAGMLNDGRGCLIRYLRERVDKK